MGGMIGAFLSWLGGTWLGGTRLNSVLKDGPTCSHPFRCQPSRALRDCSTPGALATGAIAQKGAMGRGNHVLEQIFELTMCNVSGICSPLSDFIVLKAIHSFDDEFQ